jgi:hypothetical protein
MSDIMRMADEIVKAMAALKHIAKVFEEAGCEVNFNERAISFNITPAREIVPPGVFEDISWLKATRIDYPSYEAKFEDPDFEVTEYSTWGNAYRSINRIGIWKRQDEGDVDFGLVFMPNKKYQIAQRYNPDKFGDAPNEAYIRDEYGVVHYVTRA